MELVTCLRVNLFRYKIFVFRELPEFYTYNYRVLFLLSNSMNQLHVSGCPNSQTSIDMKNKERKKERKKEGKKEKLYDIYVQ
jgi:hypothetical protein